MICVLLLLFNLIVIIMLFITITTIINTITKLSPLSVHRRGSKMAIISTSSWTS